jgi:hypothetical protein
MYNNISMRFGCAAVIKALSINCFIRFGLPLVGQTRA